MGWMQQSIWWIESRKLFNKKALSFTATTFDNGVDATINLVD
jgi:hypothetical protein